MEKYRPYRAHIFSGRDTFEFSYIIATDSWFVFSEKFELSVIQLIEPGSQIKVHSK